MNKLFFIAALSSLIFSSCDIRKNDQPATNKIIQAEIKDPTSIQLIDSVYDFGKIQEGEIVAFNFRFKNTGRKPLVITNVHASCGCTIADKPAKPILPNEIGFIIAKFNSDHKPGEAHKTITVTSNASPEFPELLLKGTVIGKTEDD